VAVTSSAPFGADDAPGPVVAGKSTASRPASASVAFAVTVKTPVNGL